MLDLIKIPLFPIGFLLLPGEEYHLHIYESRYKQLIENVKENGNSFGIPILINGKMHQYGTLAKLSDIQTMYSNGEMDVKIIGEHVIKIDELLIPFPERIYNGGMVKILGTETVQQGELSELRMTLITYLELSRLNYEPTEIDLLKTSFDFAMYLRINNSERLKLIQIKNEAQRISWLKSLLIFKIKTCQIELALQQNFFFN
jgi:hypothetical protein